MPDDDKLGSSLAADPDPANMPPEIDSTTGPKRSARLNAMFNSNGSEAIGGAPDGSGSKNQAHRSSSNHPRAANGVQKQPEGSTKRKNPAQIHHARPKKLKLDSFTTPVGALAEVEALPPTKSRQCVSMWGYRPDGTRHDFNFRLHENSEHAEKPMLENLMKARHSTGTCQGQLPTKRPGADEPNLYVLTNTEWQALSRLDRVKLYETGRTLFIQDMTGRRAGCKRGRLRVHFAQARRRDRGSRLMYTPAVCRLRKPPKKGYLGSTDYSDINRSMTLRHFLEHARAEDPLVLNALKLLSSHTPYANPLVGSGLDLEDVAYRQTAGLPSFGSESPPNEKKWFDIMGTDGTLTLGHLDAAGGTQVSPQGPGDKFWILKRDDDDSVNNGFAFQFWDPDCPDFKSSRFEGMMLPPRGGYTVDAKCGTYCFGTGAFRCIWQYWGSDCDLGHRRALFCCDEDETCVFCAFASRNSRYRKFSHKHISSPPECFGFACCR
ncbi:hypothetical protein B0H14DRAFT_2564352 [Mycena olivaceomarginata]|nr:hypothetical protein B0H14DRAFT_2564352 [Mycena olivaceomarginata]